MRGRARLYGLACALATFAGSAGAAPAPESPNASLLIHLCVDSRADGAAALAAGQAAGFTLPSPNGAAPILANLAFEQPQVRGKLVGEGVMMLIVGRRSTTLAGQPETENLCAVATVAPDDAADAAFQAWLGLPAATDHNDNPFFVFTGAPGQRQSAAALSEADAAAAIKRGDMQTAAILHLPDTTVLAYGRFVP